MNNEGVNAGRLEESTVILDPTVPAMTTAGREPTVAVAAADATEPPITPPVAVAAPPAGQRARARYVVVGVAGRGGMGTVHVAKDVDLLRRVALKELALEAAGSARSRARFIREVQVTAQLDHPHVVPVYSLEVTAGDRPAYAMKLVEGKTFAELVAETRAACQRGETPDERHGLAARLEHFLKVCDAVSYAHDRGVIHRDLKPANLMIGSHNEVYVMDWGLCRVVSAPDDDGTEGIPCAQPAAAPEDSGTESGSIVGTPRYMSPEQARGRIEELDARSDQYSLGLILQELATLMPALEGANLPDLLARAAEGRRRAVEHVSGDRIPRELTAVIDRATSVDPGNRYPSVRALADDLRRFLRGDAVEARPDSAWQKVLRFVAQHRQEAGVAVLAFATVCFAIIAVLLWRHDRALGAQQLRERRLQVFTTDVAEQGDLLQTRVLQLQAALTGTANAIEEATEHGAPARRVLQWYGEAQPSGDPRGQGVFLRLGPVSAAPASAELARRVLPALAREPSLLGQASRLLGGPAATAPTGSGDRKSAAVGLLAVFDAGLLFVAPAPASRPADPRADRWFRSCMAGSGPTEITAATPAGGAELAFCAPLRADDGSPLGSLALRIDAGELLVGLAADRPLAGIDDAALIGADGHVLAMLRTGRGPQAATLASLVGLPVFQQTVARRDVGYHEAETSEGGTVLAFDRIHPYDWTLVAAMPAARLFERRGDSR